MTANVYRVGGIALLLGGLFSLVNMLYGDLVYQGFRPMYVNDSLWPIIGWVGLVGGILLVLGFTALYARSAGALGTMGLVGFGLSAAAGMIFGVGFGFIFTLVVPTMDEADRAKWDLGSGVMPAASFLAFLLIATLLYIVGFALWGWAARATNALPSWGSTGILVSAGLALLMTIARIAIPSLPIIVGDLGFALLFLLAIPLGANLRSRAA